MVDSGGGGRFGVSQVPLYRPGYQGERDHYPVQTKERDPTAVRTRSRKRGEREREERGERERGERHEVTSPLPSTPASLSQSSEWEGRTSREFAVARLRSSMKLKSIMRSPWRCLSAACPRASTACPTRNQHAAIQSFRDWYLIAEQPAPAPHLARPDGRAALTHMC